MKSLLERLGFAPDARLLIVHADDLGATHSINAAVISALQRGIVNSGSVMVPCPWFAEIVTFHQANPNIDLGLHLTLNSEWDHYRWGPVSGRNQVPSLLDSFGYFHPVYTENTQVDLREIEIELRAQIELALSLGFQPTHLDSHQLRHCQGGQEFFRLFLKLGREYNLPLLVSKNMFLFWPVLESCLDQEDLVIDQVITITPETPPQRWAAFYTNALKTLRPGITQIVIHPAFDDDEMRACAGDRRLWGAAWRKRDYDYFMDSSLHQALWGNGVQLITWREICTRL